MAKAAKVCTMVVGEIAAHVEVTSVYCHPMSSMCVINKPDNSSIQKI